MKVHELIEVLKGVDGNLAVAVSDSEWGACDIEEVCIQSHHSAPVCDYLLIDGRGCAFDGTTVWPVEGQS